MTRLTKLTAAATAICLALGTPVLAQGKGQAKKANAKQKHRVEQSQARGCPPGLAKKSPSCVPPGQAKKAQRDAPRIHVGTDLGGRDYVVVKPWQYGLEPAPRGSRYAVTDGVLVRIDNDTAEVLDLIRAVEAIAN
ncbi:RcnB family protein [Oceanicola sp. D3]|uniref:RcnB family protein n=1 Tax=Oceanicola sp. D3 TaxID=2587163 RepID=UPI00111E48FF|nr:RcnB family protein [Oceanicola sp. D3]QDC10181.1 RcnB family protein [Oceanicola sp. D3]